MPQNLLISYLGENKPSLISEITSYLTEKGGEFSGVTFATLGRICELTMVYQLNENISLDDLNDEMSKLSSLKDGEIQIKSLPANTDSGPTSKITHRIVLSGDDQKGLLNKIIKTLDNNNALIVRMNTEKITFPDSTQYISRFAISIRDENAPECLAQIVKVAGEMKLTFRYETS
jgi:glycine cleavage system transcriptional repressor|tara:strand:+ start:1168 stop:1692 length:525 start_codon:yes stop_codon:yes gene_type:complete